MKTMKARKVTYIALWIVAVITTAVFARWMIVEHPTPEAKPAPEINQELKMGPELWLPEGSETVALVELIVPSEPIGEGELTWPWGSTPEVEAAFEKLAEFGVQQAAIMRWTEEGECLFWASYWDGKEQCVQPLEQILEGPPLPLGSLKLVGGKLYVWKGGGWGRLRR